MEVIDSKDPLTQLTITIPDAKELLKDLLVEMKDLKYQKILAITSSKDT